MRLVVVVCVVVLLISGAMTSGVMANDAAFEAGFARIDVTPTEPLRLSGYANRDRPFEGIDTPLHVRAMALKPEGGETFVLVSFDSIGMGAAFTDDVARRLLERYRIERPRFVLSATHSHTAPHLVGGLTNLFTTPLSEAETQAAERYTARCKEAIVEAVGAAIEDLQPAHLSLGTGKAGFAVNRRVVRDGVYGGFGVTPEGAVDQVVSVLKVASPDGTLRGVVFNYACHATTLDGNYNRVNGDWPGYAARDIEEAHPGATALCTIGCGADANPEPRGGDRAREHAESHGRELALEVKRVLGEAVASLSAAPVGSFGFAGLPFDRPSRDELRERLNDRSPQVARHAANMLETLTRMDRLPETYPMPVQTWRFGDELTMVFLGGEVVVDYAHRLRKELEAKHVWATAYANDVFGYVASERVRGEGGYEVDYSMIFYNLPGRWSSGTEELLIRRVREILDDPGGEPALDPDEAKQSFRLPEGFTIDLVASEPLIADPVNFAFGPDGRLWIVEMGDYPRGGDGQGAPAGKIKVLSDTNGDGVFDEATTFLDHLSYPNGVLPWRDGVLVSCAPDIFFARDTTGDGRADERDVLFTGFPEANPQHRVNGFTFGLDGLVHVAHASNGIVSPKTGQRYDLAGRDFAFDPETCEVIATSGDSQFGRCRTDDDDWFGNENSRPLFHYVLEDRSLKRNPHVRFPDPKRHLIGGDEMRVWPASRTVDRFNDLWAANRFTSACGPTIHRVSGATLNGAAFLCEPVHNLVRCVRLIEEGPTYRAERWPVGEHEFLASTDPWCRPVRIATGPDGALWIADMYRLVIEHPEWIPEAWQARLDLRAGADRGRIWRVRGDALASDSASLPDLTVLSTAELVARLDDRQGTVRDLAQQLLIWRGDESAIPLLKQLVHEGQTAQGVLHALGTLRAMRALDAETAQAALRSVDPRVVRFAVKMAEPLLNDHPELGQAVVELSGHDDARVRFQVALSLGEWDDPRAGEALGRLAVVAANEAWFRAAILSSASKHADRMFAVVLASDGPAANAIAADLVATALGADPQEGPKRILDALAHLKGPIPDWAFSAVASIANATDVEQQAKFARHNALVATLAAARERIGDEHASLAARRQAIALLGSSLADHSDRGYLAALLVPQTPSELQEAIVEALAKSGAEDVPTQLLARWASHSPRLRSSVLQTLLARPAWTTTLLDAVDHGTLSPNDFDAAARERLLSAAERGLRERAERLFGGGEASDRSRLVTEHEPVLSLRGDPVRGRSVFEKSCASCHRLDGLGKEFGPNLAALTEKSPTSLLVSILDPNRAVEAKYRGYLVVTTDGRALSGLILRESSGSMTLASADGRTVELLRKEIDELHDTGKSFMPEGLERDLSHQDLADVIAFVRSATE